MKKMIIYKNTILGFIEDCRNPKILAAKIRLNLCKKMGRVFPKEERSWEQTLPQIRTLFSNIKNLDQKYLLLEFKIPYSKKRIDVIVAGTNKNDIATLCIIELKGWSWVTLQQDSELLTIPTSWREGLHPSYEARDYKEILLDSFSEIKTYFPQINAISYLPNLQDDSALQNKKYDDVLKVIKSYAQTTSKDLEEEFQTMFEKIVDENLVDKLHYLEYKPSPNFLEHLKNDFGKIRLVLSQEKAFQRINAIINRNYTSNFRQLIIISGMAGSGKTLVAFKTLLRILFELKKPARLMLPGPEFRESVKIFLRDKKGVKISDIIGGAYAKSDEDFKIVDEAHKATGQGSGKQFHRELFKNSKFLILLVDDMQVINKKGSTKSEIIEIARKENYRVTDLRLQEQFRNAGDATYIDWLQNWIFSCKNGQEFFAQNYFSIGTFHSANSFVEKYKAMYDHDDVRLTSFWVWLWPLDKLNEDGLIERNLKIGDYKFAWNPNKIWLDRFKKLHPDVKITKELNDLCSEVKNFIATKKGWDYVAYFNTIQGSEFDYIFVYIPKLFYMDENYCLKVNISELNDNMEAMRSQIWITKGIKDSQEKTRKDALNQTYFKNRLFVSMTRGKKGVFVFAEDKRLNQYITEHIWEKGGLSKLNFQFK